MERKKVLSIVFATLATVIIAALGFYFILPAISVYSEGFWILLAVLVAIWKLSYSLFNARKLNVKVMNKPSFKLGNNKVFIALLVLPLLVLVVGGVVSSAFFNAVAYSEIIEVKEAVFEDDMPETDTVTNIALMDSDSAIRIGNRTLGSLSDVVSQFEVAPSYSQINHKGVPAKVANLEYVDFFKWMNNKSSGVPGYVEVDPVNSDAEYVKLEKPMKYVDSAYFGEDLNRKLRFSYPTKIFGNIRFELDEEGNPYYIVSCMSPKIGLFGAMDVNEVIVFNPVDGSHELFDVSETPSWIDNVYDGYLASEKFDWYGMYKNGFWNSVIGNKDCKVTTDDFGYIILGDDVWYFTGVTSITSDESNIGFIISNARTGEYKFYPVIGAEEYSAMEAAQGEVQEKGYVASFPSLINVSGEATYIMVLKDSNGIVKLCALVNVENYSIVATGSNQTDAKEAYIKLLVENGIIEESADIPETPDESDLKSAEITVAAINDMVINGNSVIYITDENGMLYKQTLASDESVMLISVGDKITVKYADTEIEQIKQISTWTKTN